MTPPKSSWTCYTVPAGARRPDLRNIKGKKTGSRGALILASCIFVCGIGASLISLRGGNAGEAAEGDGIQWVEPKRWKHLGAISFRLKEIAGQEFILIFPEMFTSREMDKYAVLEWRKGPFSATGRWESSPYAVVLKILFERNSQKLILKWEYEFRNGSDKALTDLTAFNGFNLTAAPLFKDLDLERTWGLDEKGHRIFLKDIAKIQGKEKRTMQFYPVVQGIDLSHSRRISSYGVTSPASMSGDRMGVVSRDGQWLVETIVDGPVAYFFNNWESVNGCIHAAPLFGTVEPGKTATANGRIVFSRLQQN